VDRFSRLKAGAGICDGLLKNWLPTVDALRNFFAAPTVDMKITFELLRQGRLAGFGSPIS